jgi:hypothetical protein
MPLNGKPNLKSLQKPQNKYFGGSVKANVDEMFCN